jgi:hypothetical protein
VDDPFNRLDTIVDGGAFRIGEFVACERTNILQSGQ